MYNTSLNYNEVRLVTKNRIREAIRDYQARTQASDSEVVYIINGVIQALNEGEVIITELTKI